MGSGLAECITGRAELLRTREAGRRFVDFQARLDAAGMDPVRTLTAGRVVDPFRHYPSGDAYDMSSHVQFYYHCHRAGETGHIHLFQRPRGMPHGLVPQRGGDDPDAPCHVVAVQMDEGGRPVGLFTTNRWVTGEAWYDAAAIRSILASLYLAPTGPVGAVAEWLGLLAAFYRPLIALLAEERDQAACAWRAHHPDGDELADERLEILSRRSIDPASDLASLLP